MNLSTLKRSTQPLRASVGKVARRGAVELRVVARPRTNPFLALSLAREARRHRPLLTLLGAALLCALLIFGGLRAWEAAQGFARTSPRFRNATFNEFSMPAAMGGNVVGWCALAILGGTAGFALWSTRARSGNALRTASLGGALSDWQLLPMREERWTAMLCAHPFGISALCFLLGVPMYALACLVGVWRWLDLLGVATVFLLLGVPLPAWRPALWVGRGARFDLKRYNQLIKDIRTEMLGERDPETLSASERLELSRAYERARVDATTAPSQVKPNAAQPQTAPKPRAAPVAATGNNAALPWIALFVAGPMVLPMLLGLLFSPRGMALALNPASPVAPYLLALPMGTLELLPSLPLSWPLIVGRLLFSPMPFFGFSLPPLLLVLPLWALAKVSGLQTLSAGVSASETFWNARRIRTRTRLIFWLGVGWLTAVVGYGWPLMVKSAVGARLLAGAPLTSSAALSVLWTLLLLAAALGCASNAVVEPLRKMRRGELSANRAWRLSAWLCARRYLVSLGIFGAFCLLGGVRDLGPEWTVRAWPVSAVALAIGLAFWSTELLGRAHAGMQWARRWLPVLWIAGPCLAALPLPISMMIDGQEPTFSHFATLLYSPVFLALSLFRFDVSQPLELNWAKYAIVTAMLASGLVLWAGVLTFGGKSQIEASRSAPAWWKRVVALWEQVKAKLVWAFMLLPLAVGRVYEAGNVALLRRFDGSDNPVLRDEMRRRVRREYWLLQWAAAVIVGVALLCSSVDLLRVWSLPARQLRDLGAVVTIFTFALACIGALAGPVKLGVALDRERANGQLAFLFLTPMTERDVLLGKWLPELVHSAGLFAATLLPLFVGALLLWMGGVTWSVVVPLATLFAMSVALAWSTLAQLAAATRARKSGEGASWGAFAIFGLEGALMMLSIFVVTTSSTSQTLDNSFFVVLGIAYVVAHMLAAWVAWNLALSWLRAARYGAVELQGG